MQFNADVADGMPWKFTPTQREVIFFAVINAESFYRGSIYAIYLPIRIITIQSLL